jgi:hypothetical protein
LIFRNQILHIGLSLCHFKFVYTLRGEIAKKSFSTKECSELLCNASEHLLNRCAVTNERSCDFCKYGGIVNRGLHIIGNPLNERRTAFVFVFDSIYSLLDFLRGESTSKYRAGCQVSSMIRINRTHSIFSFKHLFNDFEHIEALILPSLPRGQWCAANHQEVKPRKRDEIEGQFPQVAVELTRESHGAGDTRHCRRYNMIHIAICGRLNLE